MVSATAAIDMVIAAAGAAAQETSIAGEEVSPGSTLQTVVAAPGIAGQGKGIIADDTVLATQPAERVVAEVPDQSIIQGVAGPVDVIGTEKR
jgi:ABC-type thiamine transport system ATPase subunit